MRRVRRRSGPSPAVARSLADAAPAVLWLDDPARPPALPALTGPVDCDLVVVGGGFTGLWAAVEAKRRDPGREVVVLEAARVAFGGSGRNGGFANASLTHGMANGLARFAPPEVARLEQLGRENLDGLRADVERLGIDCRIEATGEVVVATTPQQLAWLDDHAALLADHAVPHEVLDVDAVRARLDSPTYLGGVFDPQGTVLLDPARLAWGLRDAALTAGVRLFEHTPGLDLVARGGGVAVPTPLGEVRARRAVLATNAFPPLVRAIRHYVLPVWDHVLATEPLSADQLAAIGWAGREGFDDAGNQFHYYRLTPDDRILWGGFDAVYHFGGRTDEGLAERWQTSTLLAEHFFATFPQLEGLRFTHRWGGAIDTCSRFSVFFGTALRGRASYAAGYTGLGVAATRFGARVALDLLDDPDSELLRLELVRRKPVPFPPEPLRWAVVRLTQRELAREDRTGERGPWLRTLDRFGLGFDS